MKDNNNEKQIDPFKDIQSYIKQIKKIKEDRIISIGDVSNGAILSNTSGNLWTMILPEMSEGVDKWRTQSFDQSGFSGHSVFSTKESAVKEAISLGYYLRDDSALTRMQNDPLFQRGNFLSDIVRQINLKRINHEQGDDLLIAYDKEHGIQPNNKKVIKKTLKPS
jgi:hypothetical protein